MVIDQETKLIVRMHTNKNGTGLNIYNPYFQDQKLNVVYLLFQNKNPKPLVEGIRTLGITGAITAGFEHDPMLHKLVDRRTKAVEISERVALIANTKGTLKAHFQAGEGLLAAILEKTSTKSKKIVIVGAGTVAKTFILALNESKKHKPKEIFIYNRTLVNAGKVKRQFKSVTEIDTLTGLEEVSGDILINASRIGSAVPDEYFNRKLVTGFSTVVDVTFGNENTNLIKLAKKEKKTVVSGWDMFTHQAAVVLKYLLNHDADIDRLRYFVRKGLTNVNHGAKPKIK